MSAFLGNVIQQKIGFRSIFYFYLQNSTHFIQTKAVTTSSTNQEPLRK